MTEQVFWISVTVFHVLVCMFLIAVVLLQSGKSADIAAAFGGMGSQTAFGTRTAATVLTKATTWAAIVFMVTSISLSVHASKTGARSRSVLGSSSSAPAKSAPGPMAPAPATPKK
jgi:preprotein translocase subunit SecG